MGAVRILLADPSIYAQDLLQRRLALQEYRPEIQLFSAKEGQEALLRGEKFRLVILGFDPLLPEAMTFLQIRNRMSLNAEVIALYEQPQPEAFRLLIGNGINGFVHRSDLGQITEILKRLIRE